jgi:hypothetical protein
MLLRNCRIAKVNCLATFITSAVISCTPAPDSSLSEVVEIYLDTPDDPTDASVVLAGLSEATITTLRNTALKRNQWSSLLRIAVHDIDEAGTQKPAVLGNYQIDGDTVRFRPMFPFDPGQQYLVTFNQAAVPGPEGAKELLNPVRVILALPKPEVEPTTIVTHVWPSGTRMPENQLKIYIEFSASMSHVDGLKYIRLLDSKGNEVEDPFLPLGSQFLDSDYQRYTVFFDPGRVKQGILPNEQLGRPLTEGQSYTLVVDESWPDSEDTPLKNGYQKTFTAGPADTTPLNVSNWRLRIPAAHTIQRFVVSFPEPIDYGLVLRSLGVEDSRGTAVAGTVEVESWETRWSFLPEQPWSPGSYELVTLSILEDLAGNRIGVPFEIDTLQQVEDQTEPEFYRVPFEIKG